MRSMVSSLSQSIDKVSKINNKISQDELIKKFSNTYQSCNKVLINLNYYYEKVFIPMNTWIAGKDLKKNHFIVN